LPDERRPSSRSTDEHEASRAASHLAVLSLLAICVAVGVQATAAATPTDGSPHGFTLPLVSVARGADGASFDPKVITYTLVPQPDSPDPLLERRAPNEVPAVTPLPTPVAPPAAPAPKVVYVKPQPIVGNGELLWPVTGGKISQYYSSYHQALDIAAPAGTAVLASADGVVTWAGWKNNGGGLVVAIDHQNGIVTVYNHLSSIAVAVGDTVTAGQTIAAVGCTGVCTGPHVHYEVIVDGVLVNPLRYL
jgi:murein DD-endopeptidase MepM/ murein hydrolase activator NlpD